MPHPKLAEAILEVLVSSKSKFKDETTGEVFEAVTETDLMNALRDRRWRLPGGGYFLSEVESAGFRVRQGYQFPGKVRRAFSGGETGRALSDYQTIIFL
jgi:hypothetical protein